MNVAGIIVEYNPLHRGHVHLLDETRRRLGEDTAIICVMSGDFVQRGDFALVNRRARAKAAVEEGADLVLELPLPWAVASAERFARGGVETLLATGVVTHLVFGSECGDAAALMKIAAALEREDFPPLLKEELQKGDSFPAARQRAVEHLLSAEEAAALASPNNTLGIEYCKALRQKESSVIPVALPRLGAEHGDLGLDGITASATAIRAAIAREEEEQALSMMAGAMARAYGEEKAAGRAPVFTQTSERAILAKLRAMSREEFAALDEGGEGLYHRLYDAAQNACTLEEFFERAKTRRYPLSRLRRMVLWAYLGLDPHTFPQSCAYIRPLAANAAGRTLLGRMRKSASLPILTKPGQVRRMDEQAQRLFSMEATAADLYTLGYPELSSALPGGLWREGMALL